MAKKKPTRPGKRRFPSRDKYAYVYIPKELAKALKPFAEQQERSVSYLVRKAVENLLETLRKQQSSK